MAKGEKLQGRLVNQYVSAKSKAETFVYEVHGEEASLEEFKESQGEYYREDEVTGRPLFFTTTYAGEACVITKGYRGNYRVEGGSILKLRSIEKQSTSLGTIAAQKLYDAKFANFERADAQVIVREVTEEAKEDLGEL